MEAFQESVDIDYSQVLSQSLIGVSRKITQWIDQKDMRLKSNQFLCDLLVSELRHPKTVLT